MQTMQADYQDNMSDMITSENFINQVHHPLYFNQMEQPPLDFMYQAPTMIYPDLPVEFYLSISTTTTNNKLQINDYFMQNSYDISPSFTVVPPIYQTLEDATIFDISLVEQQEMELQKNLVKDVFFSPAMMENHHHRKPSLLSSCSSISGNDDCHSVISDTTSSSSSLSYQHAKDEDEDNSIFSSDSQDQVLFFYGLDLAQSSATTVTEENDHDSTKIDGLGTTTTTATSPETTKITSSSRRTKQQVVANSATDLNDRSSSSMLVTKKKKTCNRYISKLLSNNNKKPSKQSKKAVNSENTSTNNTSDAISCVSQKLNAISAWGHKRSDNKNNISSNNSNAEMDEELNSMSLLPNNKPRFICSPSIYQKLSKQSIDWCRYCGTTEGVNWRPGPWGKRTLCNKHGCDYKGYGFACKLPRLDLTAFASETIDKRSRPVLQSFCSHCQRQESWKENQLVLCDGCSKAFHQKCYYNRNNGDGQVLTDDFVQSNEAWYCSAECQDNLKRKRVIVELPRKRLPLMRTPKNATLTTDTTAKKSARLPRSSSSSSLREN